MIDPAAPVGSAALATTLPPLSKTTIVALVVSGSRVNETVRSRLLPAPVTVGAGPDAGAPRSSVAPLPGVVALLPAASLCLTCAA